MTTDELRARILTRPSPEQLARRRRAIVAIRSLQTAIAPLTVTDLRRAARDEEEASYGRGRREGA